MWTFSSNVPAVSETRPLGVPVDPVSSTSAIAEFSQVPCADLVSAPVTDGRENRNQDGRDTKRHLLV